MDKRRWVTSRHARALSILLCLGFLLAACSSTIDYGRIQDQFNEAGKADGVAPGDVPLGAPITADAGQRYHQVRSQLTKEHIDKLDDRLKPNAYAMRAIAEWRTGALSQARETALAGLRLTNVDGSPRDRMLLAAIPALVIDEELVSKFKAAHSDVGEADYNATFPKDFATAAATLKEAYTSVLPGTPESIVFYVRMQRWRTLQNWRVVISKIDGGRLSGADARERARADAKTRLGQDLTAEITSEEAAVPANHPIRSAMRTVVLHD